jgi:predicted 3-demethylubiquinone-9 3-methyltransferase (glyoxalase superfamily)
MQKITPCLWFDTQAEEAMHFYTSIIKDSKVGDIVYYGEGAPMPAGTVLTATFELKGQEFIALNGGPAFKFNHAISFYIKCKNQEEIDELWEKLSAGGEKEQCGWVKDKYGVSWQIVPEELPGMLLDRDPQRAKRLMDAIMRMTKLDIQQLKDAYNMKTTKEKLQTLKFSVDIRASKEKVWRTLWNDSTYRDWTSAFSPTSEATNGSYAVTDWLEGSKVLFLGGDGNGMYSRITKNVPNEAMYFMHLGEVKDGVEQPQSDWTGSMEEYTLKEHNGITTVNVSVDVTPEFASYMSEKFPKAFNRLKELSEQ